jgi:hypothetical protein
LGKPTAGGIAGVAEGSDDGAKVRGRFQIGETVAMTAMYRQRFEYLLSHMERDMGFGSRILFRDYPEQMRFHRRLNNPKLLERDARLIEVMEKEPAKRTRPDSAKG